jgi:hypothetical protein
VLKTHYEDPLTIGTVTRRADVPRRPASNG